MLSSLLFRAPVTVSALPPTDRDWYLRGLRDAVGLPLVVIVATMLGVGGLARDINYPVWAGTLSTLLIWAGPAQVILLGAIASDATMTATAFAIWLSSARFLPMTVSILPLVRRPGLSGLPVVLAAHLVSMTTWVEGLARLPHLPVEGRIAYFLGFGSAIIGVATLGTHAGYYLYELMPRYLAAALLFTTPLFFAAAMVKGARLPSDWVALSIGFFITPLLVPYLPSGVDFLVIGLLGGTLAYVVQRRMRKAGMP